MQRQPTRILLIEDDPGDFLLSRELLSEIDGGPCDLLTGYGGDEFAIAMTETSAEKARQAAERLRKVVGTGSAQVSCKKGPSGTVHLTISAGAAAYPDAADSGHALIEAADPAVYQAKRRGRNRVVGFRAEQAKGSLR